MTRDDIDKRGDSKIELAALARAEQPQQLVTLSSGRVMDFIERAMTTGADPAAIERFAALAERMADREAAAAFSEALAAFQDECPPIPKLDVAKVSTRSGGGYDLKYAKLERIVEHIRPYVRRHGFVYLWDTEEGDAGRVTVVCRVRHCAGHQIESRFTSSSETSAAMSGSQKASSAGTYGMRKTLIQAFGLVTADVDDDGVLAGVGTPIGEDQVRELAELIRCVSEDLGVEERRTRGGLLKYLNVAAIEAIPQSRYADAVAALEDKRKGTR